MAITPPRSGGGYGYEGAETPAYGYAPGDYAPADPGLSAPHPMQRWINLAGAASSVALILGLVVWGYRLAVRDVSGVPVIRALEGPARIAPEDPGGDLAEHVGLSVNAIAGTGLAAPGPERVTLAPEGAGLSEDDLPMGQMQLIERLNADRSASVEAALEVAYRAPATEIADPAAEPEPAAAAAPDAAQPDLAAAPATIPASVPGVTRSAFPLRRPARDLAAEAAASAVAQTLSPAAAAPVDVDPASLPEGTRLVQLGAFDSEEIARVEWDRAASRFEALMDGKRRVIQAASSGGRTFYRLRVEGFEDVAAARRFCAALVAEGTNCIPAQVR
jgi:hypothetical protein